MKNILAILMIFTFAAALFAGCGSTARNPASQPDTASPAVVESAESDSEQPTATDASQPAAQDAGNNAADPYIALMNGGAYYLNCKTYVDVQGTKVETTMQIAAQNGEVASKVNMGGLETLTLLKEGKCYIISPVSKTVTVTTAIQPDVSPIVMGEPTFVGKGTGEFLGKTLPYKEYTIQDTRMLYYMDGDKLAGISMPSDAMEIKIEIIELSDKIPADMFEIPADYTVIEQ